MDNVITMNRVNDEDTMETLFNYDVKLMDPNRVRVIMKDKMDNEVGVLYFEKAKKRFFRKPVSLNGWTCVDANMGKLQTNITDNITPKDVVAYCQELILWSGY